MTSISRSLALAATLSLALAAAGPAMAAPSAHVNQTGTQTINGASGGSYGNTANIQDYAFQNATGNIGANVAAGNGNQQANIAYIDSHSPNFVFSGDFQQTATNTNYNGSSNQYASIGGQAFEFASGNVNANVAAGNGNQQENSTFIVADDSLNSETIYGSQASDYNTCGGTSNCSGNQANISGNAFDHSSGNVGANVAAGNGNQQMNSMTIAATSASQNNDFSQSTGSTYGGNTYDNSGNQLALLTDNAFDHATGNLGVNVAAGNGNQQLNRAEILNLDSEGANSSTIAQSQKGSTSFNGADCNVANIALNAFANAGGNIGVNLAAGNGNQQANMLTVIP